jgi:SAM-dependent methyltransferase
VKEVDDNLAWWNERAAFHLDTAFYRRFVDSLARGEPALLPLERREVQELGELGEVLHLQCHVGHDSLSLALMGATVTGVDFSEVAIQRATELSRRLGIPASFERATVGELPASLHGGFDLVFTSHGVLGWLPDLDAWARDIVACLRPGGRLYLSELHPLVLTWAEDLGDPPRVAYPYFSQARPLSFEEPGSYADKDRSTDSNTTWWWCWGLGQILSALTNAGLQLVWFREHTEGFCGFFPGMERGEDGQWRLPERLHGRYPMGFSLLAHKP